MNLADNQLAADTIFDCFTAAITDPSVLPDFALPPRKVPLNLRIVIQRFGQLSSAANHPTTFPPAVPDTSSQAFLPEFDQKLWTAADKLRCNLDLSLPSAPKPDAAVYKHATTRRGGRRIACSSFPRPTNRSSPLPGIFTLDPRPELSADFVFAVSRKFRPIASF